MGKELLLKDYAPVNNLVVAQHDIQKPCCPVIDFHTHFGALVLGEDYPNLYDTAQVVASLKAHGVQRAVNLDGAFGAAQDKMLKKLEGFEDFFINFATPDLSLFEQPNFETYIYNFTKSCKERGFVGLKFWKTLGLQIKNARGHYIKATDPQFDVIWQAAAELRMIVLIHIADPVAFFSPIDRFNERYEELIQHPEWSFADKQFFSFAELMDMQQELIAANPNTTFVIAHCGSSAENLQFVSNMMDKYQNMYVDIADRIAELGRQPFTAKVFFEKYQDRILFGTDLIGPQKPRNPIYYRFLETQDEYFDYAYGDTITQGRWKIYGLGLDQTVLEKLYYKNAEKLLKYGRNQE